jgi:GT2 family glycosyltransferase
LGRNTLYPLIKKLLNQKVNFEYEIILIPQVKLKENLLNNENIKIFYENLGKGFSYYRNSGIKNSSGKILAFIDDDELPMDNNWLSNIVSPIISEKECAATAGVKIKLGEGYVTDSISLLGFPGGGAIGFKTMWDVDKANYTKHLCSGNFAIKREVIDKVGSFDNSLKSGSEDVNLADKLIQNKIKLVYIDKATVFHVSRKGFLNFIKWNYLRGKSAAEYMKTKKGEEKIGNRLNSSKKILKKTLKTKYFMGVLIMMFNQYLFQTIGYLVKK